MKTAYRVLGCALAMLVSAPSLAVCRGDIPRIGLGAYLDNGDGTVTDARNGLMWKQCGEGRDGDGCTGSTGSFSWQEALQRAESTTFAGHDDWRLPNLKELASLTDLACYSAAVDEALFPATYHGLYWTSTPAANDGALAWRVNFSSASDLRGLKTEALAVRLVRGGP